MEGFLPNPTNYDEAARMAAVKRYDILDSPPDGSFDRITALAARQFGVPISIVTIVDTDRIWFKSHHGLPISQIGRDEGLCATTIMSSHPRILTDTKLDSCALTNPLVAGENGLRFYAGVPLRTHDGFNLGTLCVVDMAPRQVDQREVENLEDLASVVVDQLELRISARQAIAREKLLAREIDHRVMNSLQFISNLLAMQSMATDASDAAEALQTAANRVAAVAQVHQNFYSNAAAEVDCVKFLTGLCGEMAGILGNEIEVLGDATMVPTTMIQPIGLIVSELVTNAAKYGDGRSWVRFMASDGAYHLRVCNTGETLPPGFDAAKTAGLGMKVILSLVQQLRGQFATGTLPDCTGARFEMTFPM
jgi:two-component sensor histidine kinase